MKISICFTRKGKVFRLAWVNESSQGVYCGVIGRVDDVHTSYHQDGRYHQRFQLARGEKFKQPPSHHGQPLSGLKELVSLGSAHIPMNDAWFEGREEYKGDQATTDTVTIASELFQDKAVAVDCWVYDIDSESRLQPFLANSAFRILHHQVESLDCFPGLKVALTFRASA